MTTGSNGNFNFSGLYAAYCPSSSSLVYLMNVGGDPGTGSNNPAINLVSAMPVTCPNLPNVPAIAVNELTTVAAAWALAQFADVATDAFIANPSNAELLAPAFANANNLVSGLSGTVQTTTPAGNGFVPYTKIDTKADILAGCVNGGASPCSSLFAAATPSGGAAPTDTLQAAMDVALNSSNNVSALFGLLPSPSSAPFAPVLAASPTDWSIFISYVTAGYSRAITLNHTMVPNTDQTNFPVLISGTYPFLATIANGGQVQNPNGYDIVFTSDAAGQNLLNFEIDTYNPATGAVSFWVKIPTLSHTVDTTIYMFYGIPNINTFQGNAMGTWNPNYVSVWHLSGSGTTAYDSKVNANNGTMTSVASAPGEIGGAAGFNGSTSIIRLSQGISGSGPRTISAWVNSTGQEGCIYCSGLLSSSPYFQAFSFYVNAPNAGNIYLQTYGSDYSIGGVLPLNTWNLVTFAYSGGATSVSSMLLYVNGSLITGGDPSPQWWTEATPNTYNGNFSIGYDPTLNNLPFGGSIDEVEISNVALSSDWIATEYANQSSPSTFYTVGPPNSGSPGGTGPLIISLSPNSGPGGTTVSIIGRDFGTSGGSVSFNGVAASVSYWSDTRIVATVPGTATTGLVIVSTGEGNSNGVRFRTPLAPSCPI